MFAPAQARLHRNEFALPLSFGPNVYLAQTQPGFESVTWEEIRVRVGGVEPRAGSPPEGAPVGVRHRRPAPDASRARELGRRHLPDRAGISIFTALRPESLSSLRTCEDIFAMVGYHWGRIGGPAALGQIAAIARDAPYVGQGLLAHSRLMSGARSGRRLRYRVIARMAGEQQFRRLDFARAISRGIADRNDHRWRPSPDQADVEFWATLMPAQRVTGSSPAIAQRAQVSTAWRIPRAPAGRLVRPEVRAKQSVNDALGAPSELILAIRLSDERMRHRDYKVIHRPGSLRPSVAAALALLSQPQPEDVVLDPFCGTATVLIERAHLGRYRLLIGCDRDGQALSAARENVGPRYKPLELHRWDAAALPLPDSSVSAIITNLPWGIRHGSHQDNRRLYPAVLLELQRVLKPGGKMVIISGEVRLMSELIGRGLLRPHKVLHVSVLGTGAAVYVATSVPR